MSEWTAADEAEYIVIMGRLREIRGEQAAIRAQQWAILRELESRLWAEAGCPQWWYPPAWLARLRSKLPPEPELVIPDDVSSLTDVR